MDEANRGIYFDEDYNIRILDIDKFNQSKSLQDNCNVFVNNIQKLNTVVEQYILSINTHVERIEAEKLKAVGLRNRVAALEEERKRRQADQERLVAEKQEELERLMCEEQSLLKVKQEQELLITKLSDSSAGAAYTS
uniref:Intraflagellar transport particle protein 20 n=1 Tax=Chlamydomonas euryale TaxID=1486919 RepID=A0A7R9VMR7_9CHLO|mmetsp:Transcript_40107/g.119451  ORF Transcript_40107/g.119451 Transcript_40107/m.119451 type:complete len:137 (+) Transcript_40107:33-443(+)